MFLGLIRGSISAAAAAGITPPHASSLLASLCPLSQANQPAVKQQAVPPLVSSSASSALSLCSPEAPECASLVGEPLLETSITAPHADRENEPHSALVHG